MDIDQYMTDLGRRARHASRAMARASTAAKNAALDAVARAIERDAQVLKDANARDVARAREKGLDAAFVDRLTLSDKALKTMVEGLRRWRRWPIRSARSATSSTARAASRSARCACRSA